ncbi:hypothetical protein HYQ43_18585 [Paracoccus pantotrophus]|uniref:SPW repeat-containing protein n=2 Tax=Paracoccus TaxID=265 RepID=A0A7H9BYH8_PARPN|nr:MULTISPECIES: hypothetical protein [Paracoccus]QLH16109.1 hypothetical protein HYQ43_18585 [Paracoccus pantotrophus]UFM65949.1 hypothetical protein LOS78_08325 [Paracoccus sp. MA]
MVANWISDRCHTGYRIAAGTVIAAGVLLAALPLMLSLPAAALWSSVLSGAALVVLAAWLLWSGDQVADRLLFLAGLWVAVSPWATAVGLVVWLAALHVIGGFALVAWTGARLWSARGRGGAQAA